MKFGPYFPTENKPFSAIGQSVEKWPTKWEVGGAFGHHAWTGVTRHDSNDRTGPK